MLLLLQKLGFDLASQGDVVGRESEHALLAELESVPADFNVDECAVLAPLMNSRRQAGIRVTQPHHHRIGVAGLVREQLPESHLAQFEEGKSQAPLQRRVGCNDLQSMRIGDQHAVGRLIERCLQRLVVTSQPLAQQPLQPWQCRSAGERTQHGSEADCDMVHIFLRPDLRHESAFSIAGKSGGSGSCADVRCAQFSLAANRLKNLCPHGETFEPEMGGLRSQAAGLAGRAPAPAGSPSATNRLVFRARTSHRRHCQVRGSHRCREPLRHFLQT